MFASYLGLIVTIVGLVLWVRHRHTTASKNGKPAQGIISIPLKGAKVQWVNPNGGYALDGKINGTNSPFLNAGVFQLQNGVKANVLQYRSHPWLLIRKAGVNTLISTPNVIQLYTILHSVTPNKS